MIAYVIIRGVTIHFFHKRYVSRYLICITIRITTRFIGDCNYFLKSMLVDMGAAMVFFLYEVAYVLAEIINIFTKGETIHCMYRNHDYFGDGLVHDTWRPLTIQTIWCSFFEKSSVELPFSSFGDHLINILRKVNQLIYAFKIN
jgi:hypothetical protein